MSNAAEKLIAAFSQIDDPMFRERAADVRDVARRVLDHLLHREGTAIRDLPPGSIIVARELLPSLAAGLDQNKIRGLVAERGGMTAHAVILARSLGIQTVIHAEGASDDDQRSPGVQYDADELSTASAAIQSTAPRQSRRINQTQYCVRASAPPRWMQYRFGASLP